MLAKLADPTLREFRGMFIVIQMYSTKLVWNHPDFSELRRDFVGQLHYIVDIQHLNLKKTYVDIGKECVSEDSPRIYWWKRYCLQNWVLTLNPKNHATIRYHSVSRMRDLASVNFTLSQDHSANTQGLVFAQRYNTYKEISDGHKTFPFTNKNIESLLIPPDLLQLWARSGHGGGRSKHIQRIVLDAGLQSYLNSKTRLHQGLLATQAQSFGTREEYRVSWSLFHELDLPGELSNNQAPNPKPYMSIPTAEAESFLR